MGVMQACFHCVGTTEDDNEALYKVVRGDEKKGAPSLKNHAGRRSKPVAVARSLSKILNSSNSVTIESCTEPRVLVCL